MADVKWIKIVTDIFDDEKMQIVESMPEGDAIALIWFKLLCLCGKTNQRGVLMLTDKMPYTEDMLATIFRRDVKLVRLALEMFAKLAMVEIVDNAICVTNWEKHQNAEGLDKIRQQTLARVQKHREMKKLPPPDDCNVTSNATVTHGNAPRIRTQSEIQNKDTYNDERFDAFWAAYPKKVGKGAARAAWKKIKAKAETLDAILAAIESQKSSRQWLKDDGQYIPNPATWLNQERWEDGETSGCQPEESVFSMPKTFEG